VQGDRDRLLRILDLALPGGGFQFAVLEFMHHPLDSLFLRRTLMRWHSSSPEPLNDTARVKPPVLSSCLTPPIPI
jgi:hypothetical protein